jgi:hypothetical protein
VTTQIQWPKRRGQGQGNENAVVVHQYLPKRQTEIQLTMLNSLLFDSDPQVIASSASDTRNSMPPTSHSSVSHISVDASPILSSVAIESNAPTLVTAPLPTMNTATPLRSVEHPPLLDVAGLVSEHRHVWTKYTPVSESAMAEPGMASPTLSHSPPEQTTSMRVSPCRSAA